MIATENIKSTCRQSRSNTIQRGNVARAIAAPLPVDNLGQLRGHQLIIFSEASESCPEFPGDEGAEPARAALPSLLVLLPNCLTMVPICIPSGTQLFPRKSSFEGDCPHLSCAKRDLCKIRLFCFFARNEAARNLLQI